MDIPVIHEDEHMVVINKPAGLLVHPAPVHAKRKIEEPTLVEWLLEKYPDVRTVGDDPAQRPGIVHRLDKETSGVLIIARDQSTFEYIKHLFQKHEVQKVYTALVMGIIDPAEGVIDKPIGIKSGTIKRSVQATKMVKPAITEYKTLRTFQIQSHDVSLLRVEPKTGRTHQIRVHLAAVGHPIVGDKVYGGKRALTIPLSRHFLHAQSIEFTDSFGKRVRFEAELPEDLKGLLASGK